MERVKNYYILPYRYPNQISFRHNDLLFKCVNTFSHMKHQTLFSVAPFVEYNFETFSLFFGISLCSSLESDKKRDDNSMNIILMLYFKTENVFICCFVYYVRSFPFIFKVQPNFLCFPHYWSLCPLTITTFSVFLTRGMDNYVDNMSLTHNS